MLVRIVCLAVFSCIWKLSTAQFDLVSTCTNNACSPPIGNAAVGLVPEASNTCGKEGEERFCFQIGLGGQIAGTCDYCDDSNPDTAHGPELMTDAHEETTFWQSQSYQHVQFGNDPGFVNITLSFNKTYELRFVEMKFHYIRPHSMAIYKSTDYGATFTPMEYFSNQCPIFYDTPLHDGTLASSADEVLCTDRRSDLTPLSGGLVDYNPQAYKRRTSESFYDVPALDDWITFTDIRIRLEKLNTFGDERFNDADVIASYYYSISNIEINGACKCHGHAGSCEKDSLSGETRCVCEHSTEGKDCQQCKPFYQDRPWLRGTTSDANPCIRCTCNSHSDECHFDQDVYVRSGNSSGGVCDSCRDNTRGRQCEECADNYYRNPTAANTDPNTCTSCNCDARGTVGGVLSCLQEVESGRDPGECPCKANTETRTCSECKDGYYNLTDSNPDGCSDCNCNTIGTVNGSRVCDKATGQCPCKANVQLVTCSECKPEFFSFSSLNADGCNPCECDAGGSVSPVCNPMDGDCQCRPNISSSGRDICDTPISGFFCPAIDHLTFEAEFSGGTFYSDVPAAGGDDEQRQYTGLGSALLRDGEEAEIRNLTVPFTGLYRIVFRYGIAENTSDLDLSYELSMQECSGQSAGIECSDTSDQTCAPPESPQVGNMVNVALANATAVSSGEFHCFTVGRTFIVKVWPSVANGALLLDSVVLSPSLENLNVFRNHTERLSAYLSNRCVQTREMLGNHSDTLDLCQPLTCSATFEIHNGSLPCGCDQEGAVGPFCARYGGQCHCKEFRDGLRCQDCRPGRGGPDCHSCDCDALGSLSAVCARDGHCFCKPAVEGDKCDRCIPNYFDFASGEGCKSCDCHMEGSETLQCNGTTGVCRCKPGVEGDKCDRCIPGFYGLDNQGCKPCDCKINGSEPAICNPSNGKCLCKENVRGLKCQRCANFHFGLSHELEEGCLACSCAVGTNKCNLIENLREYVVSPSKEMFTDFLLVRHDFTPSKGNSDINFSEDGTISVSVDLASRADGTLDLFLQIPSDLLQDLSKAFSFAELSFTLQLSTDHVIANFPVDDAIAVVDGEILQYKFPDPITVGEAPAQVAIDLIGEGWSLNGVRQDVTDMQRLIRGMESLAIQAGFSFSHQSNFSSMVLQFTALSDDPALPLVPFKERCQCPSKYDGLQCEMCAPTHRRARKGSCTPCDCHGNSLSCVAATGVCYGCGGNTQGDHCEECLPKHYRDPRDDLCKPCTCPGTDAESQYATMCSGDAAGHVTCHDCREGHAGQRCEVCAPGYFGDPEGHFGDHRPCVTCQCNGNADPQVFPICERLNGTCINCTNHSHGRECDRCEPGYYGDAVVEKNCSACSHCLQAGVDQSVCDHVTGSCLCGDHVVGEACDRCEEGHFNVTAGCPPCQCSAIGTADLRLPCGYEEGQCGCKPGVGGRDCDRCSPGFFNFTADGCQPCECLESGSASPVCDAQGRCPCKDTVLGVKCDVCKDGYHDIEDGCVACSQCYSLVDRNYQEAVSLYVYLINVVNKLEEGDSDTSTGLLLDPQIIRAISTYRSVLEGQLERALALLAREMNATSVLNDILASLEIITNQTDIFNSVVTSAGKSTEASERFVADSRRILSSLGNTVLFIEGSLSESAVLLESATDYYNRTVENLDTLTHLAGTINTTSHQQQVYALEIFRDATDALEKAIRAYVMLCRAWDLQNETADVLSQIKVTSLREMLLEVSILFTNAKQDVPAALRGSLDVLASLHSILVNDFGIGSFRGHLDELHRRQVTTESDSQSLDAQNIALFSDAMWLKIQANELFRWAERLDDLAKELLRRVRTARDTAQDGYEIGQSSINDTELQLNRTKTALKEVLEFQAKLRDLLALLSEAQNVTNVAVMDSEMADALVALIEDILSDGIDTIRKAAILSGSALMRSADANDLATDTLTNSQQLLGRSGQLKTSTEEADDRLNVVDQRVTEDSATITALNATAQELADFGSKVAARLSVVTLLVSNLSEQYGRIPFVGASEIESLEEEIDRAEELVDSIGEELSVLRIRQGRLDRSTEDMEAKYRLLQHHRQLLRKIRDSVKFLDCEGT